MLEHCSGRYVKYHTHTFLWELKRARLLTMKGTPRHGEKREQKMTKERQQILEKVVEKLLKENKVIFDRLDEL